MAKVSVLNVAVLENPCPFHSPFRFEISFECSEALSDGEAGPMQGPQALLPSFLPPQISRELLPCPPNLPLVMRHGRNPDDSVATTSARFPTLSRGGRVSPRSALLVLGTFSL